MNHIPRDWAVQCSMLFPLSARLQQNCRCSPLMRTVLGMCMGTLNCMLLDWQCQWQWQLCFWHTTVRLPLAWFFMCKFMLVCVRWCLCWGRGGCCLVWLWNNSPILWLSLAAARAWPSACQNRQTDGRDRVSAGTWHHRAQECHYSLLTQRPTRFPGRAMSTRGWNWIISHMAQRITVEVLLNVIGDIWRESLGEW